MSENEGLEMTVNQTLDLSLAVAGHMQPFYHDIHHVGQASIAVRQCCDADVFTPPKIKKPS